MSEVSTGKLIYELKRSEGYSIILYNLGDEIGIRWAVVRENQEQASGISPNVPGAIQRAERVMSELAGLIGLMPIRSKARRRKSPSKPYCL